MSASSGYASNLGSTKPSYSCGRGRGLDFVASRLENAGTHDRQSPKFGRRAGQGGFRHHPSAQVRPASPVQASAGVGRKICRSHPAAAEGRSTMTKARQKHRKKARAAAKAQADRPHPGITVKFEYTTTAEA